ncbi:MAG: hypothetical protein AUK55_15940 [Syntrophobacteraceae bacterium CG2_30_61_12]|nr:MAG: hypothetical protein AUK55_15940 [Syntrophobacteraceae bacterium CG2_30_61_12]PIU31831.1 MAG: hypothetical protein COT06_06025 [Syntrophobacteraceae bacterium CG07_land_8_20_14_0_80_61_8]
MTAIPSMFNGLDWVLVAVAGVSVIRGLWRGAVSQVFGILGIGAGFVLALNFHTPVAARLTEAFKDLPRPGLVAMVTLFLLAWVVFAVVGHWLAGLLRKTGLSGLDRLLGALVGFAKAVLIAIIIVSALVFFFSPKDPLIGRSKLAPYLQEMAAFLVRTAPPGVRRQFDQKREEFQKFWLAPGNVQGPPAAT